MRFLVYCGGIILVLLLFLVVSPFFIDWNSYYASRVLKQIENISDKMNVKSIGNVSGTLIMPKIIVNNLHIEGQGSVPDHKSTILVDRLELKVSLLSLLLFSPKVDIVTINGLNIPLGNFMDLLSTSKGKQFNMKVFNIVNSVINTHYDGTSFSSKPISIKNANIKTVNNIKVINGLLNVGKTDYNLVVNLSPDKEQYRVDGNIYSESTKVTLSGVADDNKFDGLVVANGNNFAEFINDISKTNKTSIFSFINSNEKFSLSTNINVENKAFKLSNFEVMTDSLEGSAVLSCTNYNSCDMNVDFAKIDIDHLSSNKGNMYGEKESRTLDYFNTLISKDLNYNIKVGAKEIKYHKQVSSDLMLDLQVVDGKINVNKITAMLPGNSNVLHVEGNVSSNNLISSFHGKLKVIGDDFSSFIRWLFPIEVDLRSGSINKFSLESDLYIAPRVFSLSNFGILTDSFGDAKGQLKIKYDKRNSFITGNVDIRNVDFDKYLFNRQLNIASFMSMKWLKDMGYSIQFDTNVDDFIMRKQHVNNLSFLVNVAHGRFGIDRIRFNSADGSNLNGFIKAFVGSQDVKPNISVNLRSNKYNSAFIKFPILIHNIVDESKRIVGMKWSNEDLHFYGLENVDGNIDIKIKNFVFPNNNLIDFVFSSSLKDNLMSINKLMFKVNDGFVSTSGKIGMGSNSSSLSAVLSIANIKLSDLLDYVNVNDVTGNISISGSIQTQGKTLVDWINSLDGKMEIVAKGVNVSGVDFNKFIVNLLDAKNKSDIAALTQISLYDNSTIFNIINAAANIKKGTISSSLQSTIDNANVVASSNISLLQFSVVSLARFSFVPSGSSSPYHIDMSLQGQLWQPKMSFDVHALYEMIKSQGNKP